jgi:hypothetical protein
MNLLELIYRIYQSFNNFFYNKSANNMFSYDFLNFKAKVSKQVI